MTFLAPYTNSMRLGQGFNSYTQEICIDDAVLVYTPVSNTSSSKSGTTKQDAKALAQGPSRAIIESKVATLDTPINRLTPLKVNFAEPPSKPSDGTAPSSTSTATSTTPVLNPQPIKRALTFSHLQGDHVNQIVTFNSRSIENVSDVLDALNVSTSASIKYGTVKAGGSASFVNEHKINDSDLNYLVTVKVTNENEPPATKMEFLPIEDMPSARFTEIYGNCFIAGFLEGGEFTAIVSIKVMKKENLKRVKLAAELSLNVGPPPLTVEASASTDKQHSDTWSDTETTISVSWCGGGEIKPRNHKWSLEEVVNAANDFPNQVALYSQRISAILMDYRSLRSFQITNLKLEAPYVIADYDMCSAYTQDLFSAYMSFKQIQNHITNILKEPRAYRALPKSNDIPNPIQTDAMSLNDARTECRKGMTLVLQEIKYLEKDPRIALVNDNGEMRKPPYTYPAQIRDRLPRPVSPPAEDLLSRFNQTNLSAAEIAKITKYTTNPSLSFSPLVGDPSRNEDSKPFCSLDVNQTEDLDHVASICIHAHKHHHFDLFGDLHRFSKSSERAISSIGFTMARDLKNMTSTAASKSSKPSLCGCFHHVGRTRPFTHCVDEAYLSRVADLTSHSATNAHDLSKAAAAISQSGSWDINAGGVTKMTITYQPSDRRIAGITLFGPGGLEILKWDMYSGEREKDRPTGLVEVTQTPPVVDEADIPFSPTKGHANGQQTNGTLAAAASNGDGATVVVVGDDVRREKWVLAGLWGTGDLVVNRLGAIWRKI